MSYQLLKFQAAIILSVVLVATMVFSVVPIASAEQAGVEQGTADAGKDLFKYRPSFYDIPTNQPGTLVKWFEDHTDVSKRQIASEKHELLIDDLSKGHLSKLSTVPFTRIGYDFIDNTLEISFVPKYFKNAAHYIDQIRGIIGNDVDLTVSPLDYANPAACDDRKGTCSPLMGGIEIGVGGSCTLGFAAEYDAKKGFVTAGHCVDKGTGMNITQPNNGYVIGKVYKETFHSGTRCDCAFVSTTVPVEAKIFGVASPDKTAEIVLGMNITKSGRTTGVTSGSVTGTGVTIAFYDWYTGLTESVHDVVQSDMHIGGGDSGAPVVSGSDLVGFVIGHKLGSTSYIMGHESVQTYFPGISWGFSTTPSTPVQPPTITPTPIPTPPSYTTWTQTVLDLRDKKSDDFKNTYPVSTEDQINDLLAWAGGALDNNLELDRHDYMYVAMKIWNGRPDLQSGIPEASLAADMPRLLTWAGNPTLFEDLNLLTHPENAYLEPFNPTYLLLRIYFLERDDLRSNPLYDGADDGGDLGRLYCWAADDTTDSRLQIHKQFYKDNCVM